MNDLDGKEWVRATKSWFVINPPRRTDGQLQHPAKFPELLVQRFVRFFTLPDDWVIDPFAGVGSAMIACKQLGRNSVGIELNPEFVHIARTQVGRVDGGGTHFVLHGDSRELLRLLRSHFDGRVPEFRFLITSPPYWNMLRKSRGGNDSVHKERAERGLPQTYGDSSGDLGNIQDYDAYLSSVSTVIEIAASVLADDAYLTVVVQNMRDVDGTLRPIAWDLARILARTFTLRQEQIWCQDNKRLGCWGFPTTYVSNVHHHYCLVFQKT